MSILKVTIKRKKEVSSSFKFLRSELVGLLVSLKRKFFFENNGHRSSLTTRRLHYNLQLIPVTKIRLYEWVHRDDSLLQISYRETLRRWAESDYVFRESVHRYVVNRDLTCGAARANASFDDANAKFYYNNIAH